MDGAVRLNPATYEADVDLRTPLAKLDTAIGSARIAVLGETNHFVHEKSAFRLWWLSYLARTRRLVLVEEIGWSDGRRIAGFMETGESAWLDRVATFGNLDHQRSDRDDSLQGVFEDLTNSYPHELMKAEHGRFYRSLRDSCVIEAFYGFDIDSPGGGYDEIAAQREVLRAAGIGDEVWKALTRVEGESIVDEVARLAGVLEDVPDHPDLALLREDIRALIDSLEYTALVRDAADYEATRPAMAYREQSMKRRLDYVLSVVNEDVLVVLMGHAFHLARNDEQMGGPGIGPGGGEVSSLGNYLMRERSLKSASIWMIYGEGSDSQPLADLPRIAAYPEDTLNTALLLQKEPMVVPMPDTFADAGTVKIGHLYNLVAEINLAAQTDALMFFPTISPLVAD